MKLLLALTLYIVMFQAWSMTAAAQNCNEDLVKLEKDCNAGENLACVSIAKCIQGKDPAKAMNLFKKACLGKDNFACTRYATLLYPTKPEEAVALLSSTCKNNFQFACLLSASYQKEVVKKEAIKASKPSDYKMGMLAIENKKPAEAIPFFITSCNSNYLLGCKQLLRIYTKEKDQAKVDFYLNKLCDLNDPKSCADLGASYLLSKKHAEAVFPLTKACDSGEINSCGNLAVAHYRLDNIKLALRNFKIACATKYRSVCDFLKKK